MTTSTLTIITAIILVVFLVLCLTIYRLSSRVKNLQYDCQSFESAYLRERQISAAYKAMVENKSGHVLHCQYQMNKEQRALYKTPEAAMNVAKNHMAVTLSHELIKVVGSPKIVNATPEYTVYEYCINTKIV